jgi:hypothetical protein
MTLQRAVRAVSFVIICLAADWSGDAERYLAQICQVGARAAQVQAPIQALFGQRPGGPGYRRGAVDGGCDPQWGHGADLLRAGLQDNLMAVKAGLAVAWSSGVTEGQIHRLKLHKRQG